VSQKEVPRASALVPNHSAKEGVARGKTTGHIRGDLTELGGDKMKLKSSYPVDRRGGGAPGASQRTGKRQLPRRSFGTGTISRRARMGERGRTGGTASRGVLVRPYRGHCKNIRGNETKTLPF